MTTSRITVPAAQRSRLPGVRPRRWLVAAICLAASVLPASGAGATVESDDDVTGRAAEAAAAARSVEVVRLWGQDRYETSLAVAREFVRTVGGRVDRVVLASGRSDSSAALAAALAGGIDAPLVLVPPEGLGSDALNLLSDAGVQEALVVDWDRQLSEHNLASIRRDGIRVVRIGGHSLAALSVATSEIVGVKDPPASSRGAGEGSADGSPDTVEGLVLPTQQVRAVVLAHSRDPAAAAVLAARARLPLLLTSGDSLPTQIAEFLDLRDVTHAVVAARRDMIASDTLRQIEALGIEAIALGGHGLVETTAAVASFSTDDVTGRFTSVTRRECAVGAPPTVGVARGPEHSGSGQSMRAMWDAYSAAPLLGRLCSPLLLTTPHELAVNTNAVLYRAQHTGTTAVHVFGGSAAVSDAVRGQATEPEIPIRVALSVPDPSSEDGGDAIAVIDERLDLQHHLIGSNLGSVGNLSWSPQQRHLAFTAHQDGAGGVFIYELATGDLWRVTPSSEHYYLPYGDALDWSDDGALLAVNVDASEDTNGNGITDRHEFQQEVLVAEIRTREVRWLARGNVRARHVGWSPEGHRLVVFRAPLNRTWSSTTAETVEVIDVDTRKQITLDHDGVVTGAKWSPDTAHIAIVTYDSDMSASYGPNGTIRVLNADGTATQTPERTSAGIFEWAPDGCRVAAYTSFSGDDIAVLDTASGSLRQLTTPPGPNAKAGARFLGWHPDGRHIIASAFVWEQGLGAYETQLYRINVITREQTTLPWLNSRAKFRYGGHSPAGTNFVYGASDLDDDTHRLVIVEPEHGGSANVALDATDLLGPYAESEPPWWLSALPPLEWPQLEWTEHGIAAVMRSTW